MSVFDFMKKKKTENSSTIAEKNPFQTMQGEDVLLKQEPVTPPTPITPPEPIDPFDLVPNAPFKPVSSLEQEVDNLQQMLEGISAQLNLAVEKLKDLKRRLKR